MKQINQTISFGPGRVKDHIPGIDVLDELRSHIGFSDESFWLPFIQIFVLFFVPPHTNIKNQKICRNKTNPRFIILWVCFENLEKGGNSVFCSSLIRNPEENEPKKLDLYCYKKERSMRMRLLIAEKLRENSRK